MFSKKNLTSLFALLIVVAMLVAACGPAATDVATDEPGTGQEAEPTAAQPAETAVEPAETEAVEPTAEESTGAEGGWVTEVSFADADNLNPILSSDDMSSDVQSLLYGAAVVRDAQSGEWIPQLTTGWEVSEDGLTYTFHVLEGVNWSDGTPVTGKDFAYTFQALMSGQVVSQRLSAVDYVEAVNLVDDYTVEIVYTEVNCVALGELSLGWLPAHIYAQDFSDIMDSPENTAPSVVNGPFLFQEWVKDDHITLVRNPDYYLGAPKLEGYLWRIVPDATIGTQQLKTGEVDIYDGVEPKYMAELQAEASLTVFEYDDDGYVYVAFNMGDPANPQPRLDEASGAVIEDHGVHPILSDVRVRQAITYATDRQAVIERVRFGLGIPMEANVIPAIDWAFNADLESRAFDPERAAALLEEAGWTDQDGDGIRECHGCMYAEEGAPLALKLQTNSGNETRESIGLVLQDQLSELGAQIEFETVEWNAFLDILLGQTFDLIIIGWTGVGSDPDDEALFGSINDLPTAGFNFVSYYNTEVDELLKQGKTVPGCAVEDRAPIYKQIQENIYEESPYVFLYAVKTLLVYNNRIGGMEAGPWDFRQNAHEWYINQ